MVEFCDNVMKLPATRLRFDEDAVLMVPVVVPPAADVIENRTDWFAAEIVMLGDVEACDRLIDAPATRPNAVEDAVFTVPDVVPAPAAIVLSTVPTPRMVTFGLVDA